MAYSCFSHFADQFSYIKYFISSYRFKDMILATFCKSKIRKQRKERAGPALAHERRWLAGCCARAMATPGETRAEAQQAPDLRKQKKYWGGLIGLSKELNSGSHERAIKEYYHCAAGLDNGMNMTRRSL
jgi:hypothetical protein